MTKSVLIIVTNQGTIEKTGDPTGLWLSEAAEPHRIFQGAGLKVDIASPEGGGVPLDPASTANDEADEYSDFIPLLGDTIKLKDVVVEAYDAIYFAGGHGAMYDFPNQKDVQNIVAFFKDDGRIIGSVCHGAATFADAKTRDGQYVVDGIKITGFTNSEEKAAGKDEDVPFALQSYLEGQGAGFVPNGDFEDHTVIDGNFVTGQNPASSESTANAIVDKLK